METETEDRYTYRQQVLDEASEAVLRQRNAAYGDPSQDFDRSSRMATVLLEHKLQPGQRIEPHEIALIVDCIKSSRLVHSPGHADSWFDKAGYAACGYEAYMLTSGSVDES